MNAHNLEDVKAILTRNYADAVFLEEINPRKYRERQLIIMIIADEICGEEWAHDMACRVCANNREVNTMNNNAIPEHLRRLEAYAKKRKEIENCIQAMEYASDLYDVDTYLQYRERYKELTGVYPGKQRKNSLYGQMDRKDENNEN